MSPRLRHAQVEVRQGCHEIRPLRAVPEKPGLVLVEALIFRQGRRVPGPQLAQRRVHEPPPGRRTLPDELEILRGEEYRIQYAAQLSGGFGRDPVDADFLFPARAGLNAADKVPVPGADGALQQKSSLPEPDQLPVRAGAVGPAAGEADHSLQQVGLALGVLPPDHVADGVEGDLLGLVVAKILQIEAVKAHRPPERTGPGRRPRPLPAVFSPAGGRSRR